MLAASHPGMKGSIASPGRLRIVDLLMILGIIGVVVVAASSARHPGGDHLSRQVVIDLSFAALPGYTLASLMRGLAAYAISLVFTLLVGYWAAKHAASSRVLLPLLDLLQSIPVLGFMPALVIGLIALFPGSDLGLELAAILMIFTGQVWNMTFSFHQSLTSLPREQVEAAEAFRFSWWRKLRCLELPFATTGLVWNSMMSMAGGWFFLMISESFRLGDQDFRLPGIGSYMSVAMERGDWSAMVAGAFAMIVMIVLIDQLLWRPLVVWSERFRVEESSSPVAQRSWVLDLLRRSRILVNIRHLLTPRKAHIPEVIGRPAATLQPPEANQAHVRQSGLPPGLVEHLANGAAWAGLLAVVAGLVWGAWGLIGLLMEVPWSDPGDRSNVTAWSEILGGTGLTALRVFGSVALGTLWALPVGLAIGRSPRWSQFLQPAVQVAASFPAPMLFPLCLLIFNAIGLPLGVGSMLLMLMGTQWYILFNVIAGSQSIPSDLRESAAAFRFSRWRRFWTLEVPAVFPSLVIGWVTAAGGAWNASIVAEYLTWHDEVWSTEGLGSTISQATTHGDYPGLAAAVTCMAVLVVLINNNLWNRLSALATNRYSLSK